MKDSALNKLRICAALTLCVAFIPCLCGCRTSYGIKIPESEAQTETEIPEGGLAVPYLKTDSLNPFFINTVTNSALISLYCRSLYSINNSYEPTNDMAISEIVSEGSVKVSLDPSPVFSDGTAVTSQDVEYSFEFAKKSALYAQRLKGVNTCTASDEKTVVFGLDYADVNVLAALTFPIVKRGSATAETSVPISCGHYKFSQDGIRLSLIYNTLYSGDQPSVGTVRLCEVNENTVLENLVDSGEIDFCYSDLSGGSAKKTYSSATDIYLNNLVFIGVNCKNINFGIADMRRAMSYALDRQEIVTAGFQGFARSACVPFNTSWSGISDSKAAYRLSFYAENEKADSILSLYGGGNNGTECYVTLLCPESNSFLRNTADVIVKQLAKNNITVTVKTVSRNDYDEALENGEYDIYLGEIKLAPTMDLYAFFSYEGAAAYGIDISASKSAEYYFKYRGGEITVDEFLEMFIEEMPFIPLCFRNGRMCRSSDIGSTVGISEYSLFGNIDKWEISKASLS